MSIPDVDDLRAARRQGSGASAERIVSIVTFIMFAVGVVLVVGAAFHVDTDLGVATLGGVLAVTGYRLARLDEE